MCALLPSSTLFEQHPRGALIRRLYDDATETWWFSVIDIVRALTQSTDYQAARKYWKVLKGRLAKEGSQLVTDCYQLKLAADDGKMRETDVATAETLLRLVQSVPSPKAEPIKLWLAKVGYERMQEMADPGLSVDRARELGLDPSIVNVNGGAIALGHPLGCTGTKLTVQLFNEMRRRKQKYGMVTMCVGTGQGAASVFELLN